MAFYMYVSISGEGKVLRFAMDPSDGNLEPLGETEAPGGPAPMAASPVYTDGRRFVYVGRRDDLEVSSYWAGCGQRRPGTRWARQGWSPTPASCPPTGPAATC